MYEIQGERPTDDDLQRGARGMTGFSLQIDRETGETAVYENEYVPQWGGFVPLRRCERFPTYADAQAYVDERTKELYSIEREAENHD